MDFLQPLSASYSKPEKFIPVLCKNITYLFYLELTI